MFIDFFLALKDARLPVSLREYLTLIEAMERGVVAYDVDGFYYLARASLVKDESHLDKFDRVFGSVFKGLIEDDDGETLNLPAAWLKKVGERHLTDEEKALVDAMGGWEKLIETLQRRLREQKRRHQGGAKWIGTSGTSPYGAYGYNREGMRMSQAGNRERRAVKVWDRRDFQNLDSSVEIGTRTMKVALRRLRRFAREGAPTELDLGGTIHATAKKGYLDVRMVPERHNNVKVLLFLDVGGSMDPYVDLCEKLFSAARSEFKHLEYFYFHNCVYEQLWRDNRRRYVDATDTWDILHTYPHDYKAIFLGDASMSHYELVEPGGSVEHWNPEDGATWLSRMVGVYPKSVWLNPVRPDWWEHTLSTKIIRQLFGGRMFPLTLDGLDCAMRCLNR